MPGKILGLNINDESVTAVQVRSGIKKLRISDCARVMIEENGGLAGALDILSGHIDLSSDICFVSVPARNVSFRNLTIPFTDSRKIRKILPYELESVIPFSVDELIVDFIFNQNSEKNNILACSIKKEHIANCIDQLKNIHIDPEVIDIGCLPSVSWLLKREETPEKGLFLEFSVNNVSIVFFVDKKVVLIRSFFEKHNNSRQSSENITGHDSIKHLCVFIESTILAFNANSENAFNPEKVFIGGDTRRYSENLGQLGEYFGIPLEMFDVCRDNNISMDEDIVGKWDSSIMSSALALAIRDKKNSNGVNFRRDEFEVQQSFLGFTKEFKKFLVMAIIAALFWIGNTGFDFYVLKKKNAYLDSQIRQVFIQTLPDVKKINDPLNQLKSKIKEISASIDSGYDNASKIKVIDLIKDVSERIPGGVDMLISRMIIDQESLRITGNTDNFNTVDSIKNNLESSDYYDNVTISSADLDQTKKRVHFEIRLHLKK